MNLFSSTPRTAEVEAVARHLAAVFDSLLDPKPEPGTSVYAQNLGEVAMQVALVMSDRTKLPMPNFMYGLGISVGSYLAQMGAQGVPPEAIMEVFNKGVKDGAEGAIEALIGEGGR